MRISTSLLAIALVSILLGSCKEKKQSDDIIAPKVETPKPQGPISMQPYAQQRDVQWLGKPYQVEIKRTPDDSLHMVTDENGQKFVDNRISLRIIRADGSVFFSRQFTKSAFSSCLTEDYRQKGILEGFVFDRVEGNNLFFAASVSLPQSDDEYIPMVVSVSNFGDVGIRQDNSLDTSGADPDDDGV